MITTLLISSLALAKQSDSVWSHIPPSRIQQWTKELTSKAPNVPENTLFLDWGPYETYPHLLYLFYRGHSPFPYLLEEFKARSVNRYSVRWDDKQFSVIDSSCWLESLPRAWDTCRRAGKAVEDMRRELAPDGPPSWRAVSSFYLDFHRSRKRIYPLALKGYSSQRKLDTFLMKESWTLSDKGALQKLLVLAEPDDGFLAERTFVRHPDAKGRDTLIQEFGRNRYSAKETIDSSKHDEVRFGYDLQGRILWDRQSYPPSPKGEPIKGVGELILGCLRRYHFYDNKGRDSLQLYVTPTKGILRGLSLLEYNQSNEIVRRTLGAINVTQNRVRWLRSERWTYDSLGRLTEYGKYHNAKAWDTLSTPFQPVQQFPNFGSDCEY
ncbi:MAG: hypothetical protein IPK50_07660 [Fibrobacterota bacterium]|nr:MAG: hypothetical protein IPK50_07660 [Fibrobacterota bacterium]